MIGKTLSHYEILEPLGAGGMGEVYLAEDTRLGREVAVKVLPSELANDSDRLALFEEEARSAAALNHPGVCTIHEVGHALDRAFIVMEYVEGQSLADSIPAGGLPPQTVARYGIQISDGLDHAHQHGIIHRDLKSANVMVTSADRLKILDFGLARRLEKTELDKTALSTAALTEFGSIGGTLPYLPPEVLRGQPADERSDIWALGVVLYEAATAELPFTGETGFELVSAILRDPSKPLPSHVPAALGQVIARCLSKEPGRRYRSAGQVQSALEAVESGRADVRPETAAGGAGEPSVAMRRPGAHRIVLVGAAAVIVAFLLVGALESAVQLEPDFRTGHVNLGRLYVGQREYREALASFERARRIRETPALVAEISAIHAALGDRERSLEELEKALAAGFRDFDAIDEEERFASLREDPRFQELLRGYRQ